MSHHDSDLKDPPIFHDKSKWEEPVSGDPYLTLWDVNRTPRTVEAMDPNHRLRLPVKVLHPDLHCPICCGYLKKTTTVMECMHRFCEECIETSIRLAKKECPTCRIHVPSRRSLRSDKRFDKLIQCILGDVEEQDRKETRRIELFNQGKLMGNTTTIKTRQRNRKTPPELSTRDAKGMVTAVPSFVPFVPIHGFEPSPLVTFFLVRHVQEKRLDPLLKDSIRMSGKASISVLQSFLSHKLSYAPATDIQILFRMPTTFVVLHPNLKLRNVQQEQRLCSAIKEEMVLYYRIYASP